MLKLIIIFLLTLYTKSQCSENCTELYSSTYSKEETQTYPPGIILDSQISEREVSGLKLPGPMASVLSQKYEAGLMSQSEFENFSSHFKATIQPPLLDLEAPNTMVKASTPIDLNSQDRKNTPEKEFSLFSIWNNISTTKKLALSLIPDLGYFAFLSTALITQEPTLIKTILPFSICYGAYFLCAFPLRIKSCLKILCKILARVSTRPMHLRTPTLTDFQSQLSQFTRADFRN